MGTSPEDMWTFTWSLWTFPWTTEYGVHIPMPCKDIPYTIILYHLNQFGTPRDLWHAGRIHQFDSLASWLWHIWNFRPVCLELTMTSAQPCFINKRMSDGKVVKWREIFLSLHSFFNIFKAIWVVHDMKNQLDKLAPWAMTWRTSDPLGVRFAKPVHVPVCGPLGIPLLCQLTTMIHVILLVVCFHCSFSIVWHGKGQSILWTRSAYWYTKKACDMHVIVMPLHGGHWYGTSS